ncbi:unnamed protein product [Camellia sinensis]
MKCMSGADVVGKSKGLQWMYIPVVIGMILNQLMEDDDEVDVSMDAGEAFWGFRTFRNDDNAMERGELEKAIKDSRSFIIVFSKDYASSRRCLDELVMILECTRNFKHVILPVFYGMDPTQVRKQTGSVAEAFAGHEAQFEVEIDERNGKLRMEKVEGWRKALREVVDLGGFVGMSQSLSKIIVREIANKLDRTVLSVTPYVTSIESRVKDINSWLQEGSNNVGIMVICGMDGIGKTSIAKTAYNQNFDRFEAVGIQYLIRRCLVTIDGVNNKLMMHQLLRDMGREIIRQESPKEPGKCSRVWRHKNAYNVLKEKTTSLAQLWKGTKMLRLLKILNLSHSHGLVDSPDFLLLPNLEKLKLKDCINLVGVHESVGKLERLVLLNLRGCRNLTKLPREIVLLKSLEELILSDCSSLDKLPPDLVKMESLKVLHADGINQLSSNRDLSTLSSLQTLRLGYNPICSLPGSLKGLTRSLETVANLPNLFNLLMLDICHCEKLVKIQGILKLEPIGNIDLEMINNLSLTEWDFMGIAEFELYS